MEAGRASAVEARMPELRRGEPRVSATVPVIVEGHPAGLTRNVSPTGIFFETDAHMENGHEIRFSLEFDGPSGKLVMDCSGEIVRIERLGMKLGVAAKIVESKLELREMRHQCQAHLEGQPRNQ
jgi:hypothetical protein